LSVTLAKTVHTTVFLLLRSRATNGGEKRLVEEVELRQIIGHGTGPKSERLALSPDMVPNLY